VEDFYCSYEIVYRTFLVNSFILIFVKIVLHQLTENTNQAFKFKKKTPFMDIYINDQVEDSGGSKGIQTR
jgi:hypothetical protein